MSALREDGVRCAARFSENRLHRYSLTRTWDVNKPYVAFIGLNPSTADELADDPTVRRCINFARDWGAGTMVMLNAFAYRATDPRDLKDAAEAGIDPIGRENDQHIFSWSHSASTIVACWGVHGDYLLRGRHLQARLRAGRAESRLRVFGLTKDGHPKHPLYLAKTTRLVRWA